MITKGKGLKLFGLLENMEYKEKYMKSIFEWRKRMLHNFIGSDIFPSQQLTSKSSKSYSSSTGDGNQSYFCDNIKEDLCLQTPLFQGSKMDSMDRRKEQGLDKGEDSEEREDTGRQKDTDSKTDKEPNTYEHKNY
jgi:hypothetical protein